MAKKRAEEKYGPSPILLWILALVLLIALFFLVNSSLFNVSEINVIGASRFSHQDIILSSGITTDTNIIHVNEEVARQGIQQNPYLMVKDIKRVFPTCVEIVVEERIPSAQIATVNGYYIINEEGIALSLNELPDQTLITVKNLAIMQPEFGKEIVPTEPDKLTALNYVLSAAKENSVVDKIAEVNILDITNVVILYEGNITVEIGYAASAEVKLAQIEATVNAVRDKLTEKSVINMQTEGAYFLKNNS